MLKWLQVTCYDCVPTEAEVKNSHAAVTPLNRFITRCMSNPNSLRSLPNNPNPATTDGIPIWDSYMLDINNSWKHRCQHFQLFRNTCCPPRPGAPPAAAITAAPSVTIAAATAVAAAQPRVAAAAAAAAAPSTSAQQEGAGLKRKSAPGVMSESQPPAARMRLQELQQAAATAIEEAEQAERMQASQASVVSQSRGKVSCCHVLQHLLQVLTVQKAIFFCAAELTSRMSVQTDSATP